MSSAGPNARIASWCMISLRASATTGIPAASGVSRRMAAAKVSVVTSGLGRLRSARCRLPPRIDRAAPCRDRRFSAPAFGQPCGLIAPAPASPSKIARSSSRTSATDSFSVAMNSPSERRRLVGCGAQALARRWVVGDDAQIGFEPVRDIRTTCAAALRSDGGIDGRQDIGKGGKAGAFSSHIGGTNC